jgi:hypothetical protein
VVKLHEEKVFKEDMERSFALLNTESAEGTMGVHYLLTSR